MSFVNSHTMHELLGDRLCVPDHSVLVAYFSVNVDFVHDVTRNTPETETPTQSHRFKLNKIPTYFMDSDISRLALIHIIKQIWYIREVQGGIDIVYSQLCSTLHNEMQRRFPQYYVSGRCSKRRKTQKPYWNDKLSVLWNTVRSQEMTFCGVMVIVKEALGPPRGMLS